MREEAAHHTVLPYPLPVSPLLPPRQLSGVRCRSCSFLAHHEKRRQWLQEQAHCEKTRRTTREEVTHHTILPSPPPFSPLLLPRPLLLTWPWTLTLAVSTVATSSVGLTVEP